MNTKLPPLDASAFRAVCAYAVAHIILPDDVIRLAAGLRSREPFLIDASQLVGSSRLGKRYLSILAELYRGDSAKFEIAAPKVYGTKRIYFGRSREEIESTGNSNHAALVPDTPWYAIIQNSDLRRTQIVSDVMMHMGGFSPDYTLMVSRLCLRSRAELPSSYVRALSKLTDA